MMSSNAVHKWSVATLAAWLLLAASSAPAFAGILEDDEARKAILDLRKEVRDGREQLNRELREANARLDTAQRSQLELVNTIERLREEAAKLRGQVEVLSNELAGQQKRSRELYGDLDARVKSLEPRKASVDGRQGAVERSEEQAFNSALELFRSGDMRGTIASLTTFQKMYPQSILGPSSQFWIGAAQYGIKDYKASIATLTKFIESNPDSPRLADAWLTIGNAQLDSGDRRAANRTFGKVVTDFPGTPAAETARERVAATTPSKR